MSVIQEPVILSFVAAADLSAKQYFLVKISDSNTVALCGDGDPAVGVLINKPKSGEIAQVQIGGLAKVVCGTALNAPIRLGSDAAGKAVLGASADYCVGLLTQDVSGDGSIGEVILAPVPHLVP